MGWASAGQIFDPVAQALIDLGASDEVKQRVLGTLIKGLHEGDWDTEDESLDQFKHDPAIRAAFAANGIHVRCMHQAEDGERECFLPEGHEGGHAEYEGGPTWDASSEPKFVLCSYGEGRARGSGCIRQEGHEGAHLVTNGDEDDD